MNPSLDLDMSIYRSKANGTKSVELWRFTPSNLCYVIDIIEGSLETKVPTIWTDEKQHSQEEAEPGRNSDV